MKIKVINKNRVENVTEKTTGKNNSLLNQMKKMYETISERGEDTDFDKSTGSIQIISGSFSELKPMAEEEGLSFLPKVTSTPNITDDENNPGPSPNMEEHTPNPGPSTSKMDFCNIQDGLSNLTFNFETDVLEEKLSFQKYLEEVKEFVSKTQNLVEKKMRKRTILIKKISKYQKKIRNLEKSLRRIDKVISFGEGLPSLCESVFYE